MFDGLVAGGTAEVDVDRLPYAEAIAALAEVERQAAVLAGLAYRLIRRALAASTPDAEPWVADDVALAARISPDAAYARLHTARRLAGPLAAVGQALAAGQISLLHALAVDGETRCCSEPVAAAVAARLTPVLADLSPGQVRARARRLVAELDPGGAAERMHEGLASRGVYVRDGADGIGELAGVGSAAQVAAAYAAVHALAATYRDGRTSQQKHADAFFALAAGLATVPAPPPAGDAADLTDTPDPSAAAAPAGTPPPAGTRPATRLHVTLRVTVDLPTLLGLAEHPGQLDGYGPIPAPLARTLAADATWQRLVTDPLTGHTLDLARRRYRPSAALAAYVRTRDPHCMFARCSHRDVQLDHRIPYDSGGPTNPINLTPLCGHHHNGKTQRLLAYTRNPDGSYSWRTSAGQTGTTPAPRPYD